MNTNGNFRIKRELILTNAFRNPLDFRLFFLVFSQAMFRDGVTIEGERLKTGEWKRSYRKLQEDLSYYENRTIKQYGIATIKRSVERLKAEHLLDTRNTNGGTVFIIPNYQEWQGITEIEKIKAERIAERKITNSGTKRNNKIQEIIKDDEEDARTREGKLSFFDSFYLAYGRQPNPKQLEILLDYIETDNLQEEDIIKAIDKASRVSSHFNYLTAILKNWGNEKPSEKQPTKGAKKDHGKKRKYSDHFEFDW